jgi:hypothetical protein
MAAHEACVGATDEWYTPPWLFEKLGLCFDIDAASPGPQVVPWIPARNHNGIVPWLTKLANHGDGLALVPNRTGADWWQDFAARASGLLFVRGKIRFLRPDNSEGASPGYGNVLLAFGSVCAAQMRACAIDGFRT